MITRALTEFDTDPFGCSAKGQRCFYCGEFLQDPAVMWNGFRGGENLYLHGLCVKEMFPKMLRDALEIEYQGNPCWNQLDHSKNPSR